MFDKDTYKKDCDRLTLGRETLEEMIFMSEQKKTKKFKPLRVVVLAAALVAALGLTAAATDGPVKAMIKEFFYTYTVTGVDDCQVGIITVSINEDDVMIGTVMPTMAYEERDGHCILALDGEEIDVTEAMEKDGFYERELEGAILRITAAGVGTYTALDQNGESVYTINIYLLGDGADLGPDMTYTVTEEGGISVAQSVTGELAGAVVGTYTITEESGEMLGTDSGGILVNIPQE